MFVRLVPASDSAAVPAIYLGTLLQEVQLAFTAPDTIVELSDGGMSVWLHGDGRVTNPRAADTLLPSELTRALTAAIDSVSRRGGIGPVFPQLRTDSVELRLIVHYPDQRTPLSVPFLRVALPAAYFEFEVEKPAVAKPGNPAPRYPTPLRENGVSGEVLAQFVVDRDGRAEMRTFRVLKSSHADFTRAVRAVLPQMKFFPAELDGCKVRQIVQLPFAFKLNW
jgi:TonB family protein